MDLEGAPYSLNTFRRSTLKQIIHRNLEIGSYGIDCLNALARDYLYLCSTTVKTMSGLLWHTFYWMNYTEIEKTKK